MVGEIVALVGRVVVVVGGVVVISGEVIFVVGGVVAIVDEIVVIVGRGVKVVDRSVNMKNKYDRVPPSACYQLNLLHFTLRPYSILIEMLHFNLVPSFRKFAYAFKAKPS